MSRPPHADVVADTAAAILDRLEETVVGKNGPLSLVLGAVLAGGHVLIEDLPGLAKTLTARLLAETLGLTMSRVQFTPDLLPADVTGSSVLDREEGALRFVPGPLFANLVLGDEINRAPPKTQAALLEAMQEQQVTVDGTTRPLPHPFHVIATQNPIEYEGTYPLPEAQLDRFLVQVRFGYPTPADEAEILRRRMRRGTDDVTASPVCDADGLRAMQRSLEAVHVSDPLLDYIARVVAATREHPSLETGASPRGSLALLKLARAWAAMAGRDFVTPEDVKALAGPALAHRLILTPERWIEGVHPTAVVEEILAAVPTPSVDDALSAEA